MYLTSNQVDGRRSQRIIHRRDCFPLLTAWTFGSSKSYISLVGGTQVSPPTSTMAASMHVPRQHYAATGVHGGRGSAMVADDDMGSEHTIYLGPLALLTSNSKRIPSILRWITSGFTHFML